MDQEYEYQMERIGPDSIEADLRRRPPSPRRSRMRADPHSLAPEPEYSVGGDSHPGTVSLGPSGLPRRRLSTRSHQSHVSYQDDQETEYSFSRGSHGHPPSSTVSLGPSSLPRSGHRTRSHQSHVSYQDDQETEYSLSRGSHGHPASSTVSLGPRSLPRRTPSTRSHQSHVTFQDDQETEYSLSQGSHGHPPSSTVSLGPSSLPRRTPSTRSHQSHVTFQDDQETEYSLSQGSLGHPPSSTVSRGPSSFPRSRLSARSNQRDVSFQHNQEVGHSSSQGSHDRPPVISHSRQEASERQYPLTILERMESSDYTQASTDAIIETLKAKGFSSGLARELASNARAFANRIWVVDNSGSMVITDGHGIFPTSDGKMTETRVSRWEELQETILYHAEMAGALNSPTVFRLLNDPGLQVGPQEFSVAQSPPGVGNVQEDIRRIRTVMRRAEPLGVTPLTSHILQIQKALHNMAPRLKREGKRVAVILATDGLPTDEEGFVSEDITEEFVKALKSMEGLPIWLVIRLCTDETKVTDFYNSLDGQFELSLEVLDDFVGEAKEVHRHNKWLNYSMPLHRCRELGYHDRLFDLIDERPLTKGELRDFCGLLFGFKVDQIPDPNTDWKNFVTFIEERVALESHQYNPIKKKVLPLIRINALNRLYGERSCTIM